MVKVLSQSGISLADVYDVEGSIAGTDELLAREVALVHEMGGQILSERLQAFFLRMSSGAIAQNTNWTVTSGQLPDCPNRILGVSVFIPVAQTTDVSNCMLSIQNGEIDREIPFYTWDESDDPEVRVRWDDAGAGAANFMELRSSVVRTPTLATRLGLGEAMPVIRFRGATSGFGAGTLTAIAMIHILRATPEVPTPGHPSSHGLPLPSW